MAERAEELHPNEYLLQPGSLPSIWCSGCGIGTVVNTFIQAVGGSEIDPNTICVVSGIGCTGKIAYSVKFNSFQTIYCNPIRCASELKLKRPDSKVVVFLNDVDLMVSDADDFIGIGKKGQDLLVIYINTFIYHVFIEEKALSTTPFAGVSADNSVESPFNIPHLAESCGSQYIARWTPLHARRLMYSITETLQKPGFSVIEVISPCLMYYASNGIIGGNLDRMKFLHDNSIIKHDESTEKLDIRMQKRITLGRFVNE
jgi:2-oxoglutarate ferredoxin oxidoreductase subunit beta